VLGKAIWARLRIHQRTSQEGEVLLAGGFRLTPVVSMQVACTERISLFRMMDNCKGDYKIRFSLWCQQRLGDIAIPHSLFNK